MPHAAKQQQAAGRVANLPAHLRLRYDPVADRCYWLTENNGWMNIRDINKYCLLHILTKLRDDGREEGRLYQVVALEASRRHVLDELPPAQGGWEHGD